MKQPRSQGYLIFTAGGLFSIHTCSSNRSSAPSAQYSEFNSTSAMIGTFDTVAAIMFTAFSIHSILSIHTCSSNTRIRPSVGSGSSGFTTAVPTTK